VINNYATDQLKPFTVRPLLPNANGGYSFMLVRVNSVFTIPDPLGNDRECNAMPN
jgi:hypothetical protein